MKFFEAQPENANEHQFNSVSFHFLLDWEKVLALRKDLKSFIGSKWVAHIPWPLSNLAFAGMAGRAAQGKTMWFRSVQVLPVFLCNHIAFLVEHRNDVRYFCKQFALRGAVSSIPMKAMKEKASQRIFCGPQRESRTLFRAWYPPWRERVLSLAAGWHSPQCATCLWTVLTKETQRRRIQFLSETWKGKILNFEISAEIQGVSTRWQTKDSDHRKKNDVSGSGKQWCQSMQEDSFGEATRKSCYLLFPILSLGQKQRKKCILMLWKSNKTSRTLLSTRINIVFTNGKCRIESSRK